MLVDPGDQHKAKEPLFTEISPSGEVWGPTRRLRWTNSGITVQPDSSFSYMMVGMNSGARPEPVNPEGSKPSTKTDGTVREEEQEIDDWTSVVNRDAQRPRNSSSTATSGTIIADEVNDGSPTNQEVHPRTR